MYGKQSKHNGGESVDEVRRCAHAGTDSVIHYNVAELILTAVLTIRTSDVLRRRPRNKLRANVPPLADDNEE